MPYKIKFENIPAGIAVALSSDEKKVLVQPTLFTSTEDGQYFVKQLEGYPQDILNRIAATGTNISPSSINHMLAVINPDGSAIVYVNELRLCVFVRTGRVIKEGEVVLKDDIINVESSCISDIDIPYDAGILLLFSVGWRKGLFYDFRPLNPLSKKIEYNFEGMFSQLYSHVMFQERFSITEEDWAALFAAGWFPFNSLPDNNIQEILNYVRTGLEQTRLVKNITEIIKIRVDHFRNSWLQQDIFNDHSELLTHALDRFFEDDYISCVSILYPRIEGLLRTNLKLINSDTKATQDRLSSLAVNNYIINDYCLLLPRRFQTFLKSVYFSSFNPQDIDIKCSRNSISHGVASQQQFNQKSAVVAIMIVQQLYYFFTGGSQQPLLKVAPQ